MAKAVFSSAIIGMVLVLGGCATMGGGMTPEEEIRAQIEPWSQAFVAQDLDTVMTFYSEDFSNYENSNKAALRDYLQSAIDMGYMNDATVDTTEMVVTVDGETATAGPIKVQASFGSAVINLSLADEAEGWKIVDQAVEMQ